MAIQDDNTILNKGDLKAYHQKILPYLGGNMMVSTNNSDYYSTDEKVVGVWIDGRPLYQKTFSGTSPTSDTCVYTGSANDYIVNMSGVMNGAALNYYDGTSWRTRTLTMGNRVYMQVWGFSNLTYYVTIQYIKTTDTAGSATTTPGAYDINFPNTWKENTEIYFGNGLYGQRFTGTGTAGTSVEGWTTVSTNNLWTSSSFKVVKLGGNIHRASGNTCSLPTFWSVPSFGPWFGNYNGNSVFMIGGIENPGELTFTYDVWVTYTK